MELRRIGEEQFRRHRVLLARSKVEISIELFLVVRGQCRAGGPAVGLLWRRYKVLSVRQLGIEKSQGYGINGGGRSAVGEDGMKRVEQGRFRAVVGEPRRNQHVLVNTLLCTAIDFACALVRSKVEDPISPDGSTQSGAVRVTLQHRPAYACLLQIGIIRVQRIIAEVLV